MRPLLTSLLLLLPLAGCVHALTPSEVDALTTCRNTDLKKIRQSLLLNGYEVKSETATDLVTDWKQVSGYGADRLLQRITVVQTEPTTYRFKVRLKEQYLTREGPGVVSRDRRHRRTTVLDLSQPVEVTDDFDPHYDDGHQELYEETQKQVCGL